MIIVIIIFIIVTIRLCTVNEKLWIEVIATVM